MRMFEAVLNDEFRLLGGGSLRDSAENLLFCCVVGGVLVDPQDSLSGQLLSETNDGVRLVPKPAEELVEGGVVHASFVADHLHTLMGEEVALLLGIHVRHQRIGRGVLGASWGFLGLLGCGPDALLPSIERTSLLSSFRYASVNENPKYRIV